MTSTDSKESKPSTQPNGHDPEAVVLTEPSKDQAQSASTVHDASDDDGSEDAELLRQLDSVDGVAKEIEDKLDEILEDLDVMLASLESAKGRDSNETSQPEASRGDSTG
jgi:hypothetical protein